MLTKKNTAIFVGADIIRPPAKRITGQKFLDSPFFLHNSIYSIPFKARALYIRKRNRMGEFLSGKHR